MELRILEEGPPARVALVGRLDIAEVHQVETRFVAATATQRRSVIVDLSGVSFIGSIGVGMLMGAARALKRHGAAMVLLDPQPFVERVLDLSRITDVVPVVRGMDEALRIIGPAEPR